MKARQQADPPREDSQRQLPLSISFYYFFFLLFYLFFLNLFIFFRMGPGLVWAFFYIGVVELPGWLPINTGIQWEMSYYWGNKPALPFLYNIRESNIQMIICLFSNFDFGIYNFMEDSFNIQNWYIYTLIA